MEDIGSGFEGFNGSTACRADSGKSLMGFAGLLGAHVPKPYWGNPERAPAETRIRVSGMLILNKSHGANDNNNDSNNGTRTLTTPTKRVMITIVAIE